MTDSLYERLNDYEAYSGRGHSLKKRMEEKEKSHKEKLKKEAEVRLAAEKSKTQNIEAKPLEKLVSSVESSPSTSSVNEGIGWDKLNEEREARFDKIGKLIKERDTFTFGNRVKSGSYKSLYQSAKEKVFSTYSAVRFSGKYIVGYTIAFSLVALLGLGVFKGCDYLAYKGGFLSKPTSKAKKLDELDNLALKYEKELEINPGVKELHYSLAGVYAKQQKFDKSINELNISLRLDPNYTDAQKALEKVLEAKSNLSK